MILTLALLMQAANPPVTFAWLSGYWLSCDDGREVTETWSDMRGGQLLGTGITFRAGKISWEQTRIGPSGTGYAFFAQPSGQPAAEFPMIRYSENEAVFENPTHDYPQRVIYRREGAMLIGRIEGTFKDKSDAHEWRYRSASLNTRCP